jgi:hypothetical protein
MLQFVQVREPVLAARAWSAEQAGAQVAITAVAHDEDDHGAG